MIVSPLDGRSWGIGNMLANTMASEEDLGEWTPRYRDFLAGAWFLNFPKDDHHSFPSYWLNDEIDWAAVEWAEFTLSG